jgi:hypothetical protein
MIGHVLALLPVCAALNAYGHAYSRPDDFTPAQYAAIAADFRIFTVEKDHAAAKYGTPGAPKPFATNSYAATVGTARKIKALNASVQVLMYWNSALHFNFYECEADVQASWVMAGSNPHERYYNYSVPAFREWWVRCAVESVRNSSGALDGLFIDAVPKVAASGAKQLAEWGAMIDSVRKQLGPAAPLLDNGFFDHRDLAGPDAWAHTGFR